MIDTVKVTHSEVHWSCGDDCCDNYSTTSNFMYKDRIYQFESSSPDGCTAQFIKEVLGVEFEEEYEYKDLDDENH